MCKTTGWYLGSLSRFSEVRGELARVVLWGMEPVSLEQGLELSEAVESRLDALVDAVVQELRDWGIAIEPR